MNEQYTAATGISYKFGGEYRVAVKGDDVEFDNAAQAKAALERGIVKLKAAALKAPPQKKEVAK